MLNNFLLLSIAANALDLSLTEPSQPSDAFFYEVMPGFVPRLPNPHISESKAMAKLQASRTAFQSINAPRVGFMRDTGLEKQLYRDCKIGAIYEGTDNMQLETTGKYTFRLEFWFLFN